MIEANRWKLGLFIIIGVVLILGGIVFFGVAQFFVPKVSVMTVFNESVDGLSVGSPVNYSGVPMGTVTEIKIEHRGNISVYMELYPDVLSKEDSANIIKKIHAKDYIKKFLKQYVNRGFRCTLQLAGISGNKYIGIAQYNIPDMIPNPELKKIIGNNLYLPSVPTYIAGVAGNVSEILNKIAEINFNEIGANVKNSLDTIQSLLLKVNSLLTTLESQELGNILLQTTSKLDETLQAATELCNQISRQPNSVLRGNESKVIFPSQ